MKQVQTNLRNTQAQEYRKALRLAIALPAAAIVTGVLVMLIGQENFSRFMPPCMFSTLTGWNCLSCGATRATFALLHGDLRTAFWYNPLYVVFLLWPLYLYTRLILSLIVRPYRKYVFSPTLAQGIAVAVVCIAFSIIRNLPFYRAIFY